VSLRSSKGSYPTLLTVSRFAAEDEAGKRAQRVLVETIRGELAGSVPAELVQPWQKEIGVDSRAQRWCQKRGDEVLVFGNYEEGRLNAHVVFEIGRYLTHIDQWSKDTTRIEKSAPVEPPSERTRVEADSIEALARRLSGYARASWYRHLSLFTEASFPDFQPSAPDESDELAAMTCAREAQVLVGHGDAEGAMSLTEAALERFRTPRVMLQLFELLYGSSREELFAEGSEANRKALQALREAAQFDDDPEHGRALYNLLQVLPDSTELEASEEHFAILDQLSEDPTYRRAWWVERMRGSLHYRTATRSRAFRGDAAASGEFSSAARSYSKALRLRRRSELVEPELGPEAPRKVPRSPVLQANAYDAHHLAGHPLRAAWHHRRAQATVRRLYRYGRKALQAADLLTARHMFELLLAVGWSDRWAAEAGAMAAIACEQLGLHSEAEEYWRRALEVDEVAARMTATSIGARLPGDVVDSDEETER
jgi:tetratricopeptide (TPR) repeat protein